MENAWVLLVVVAATLISCSSEGPTPQATSCEPALTEAEATFGGEAQAQTTGEDEVWALFFNTWPMPAGEAVRIPVDDEVKIVWRSTGDGPFSIKAKGPDGELIAPTWGPDPHGSSNWSRPGQEWGTGWTFPSSGCWTFEIVRGELSASLAAQVFASS